VAGYGNDACVGRYGVDDFLFDGEEEVVFAGKSFLLSEVGAALEEGV